MTEQEMQDLTGDATFRAHLTAQWAGFRLQGQL